MREVPIYRAKHVPGKPVSSRPAVEGATAFRVMSQGFLPLLQSEDRWGN
jgi:hypothetical protein